MSISTVLEYTMIYYIMLYYIYYTMYLYYGSTEHLAQGGVHEDLVVRQASVVHRAMKPHLYQYIQK